MTCPRPGCFEPSDPRSTKGYCTHHKHEARAAMRQRFADSATEREQREGRWADLYARAHAAGQAAGEAAIPTPMVVTAHASPLDDSSPVERAWYVSEGPCGFAWVNIRPGNSSFARWLVKRSLARSSYHGGVDVWVGAFGQSLARKEAYARAFAGVLRAENIRAYASSRMD